MSEYYLDIETNSREQRPKPTDEVLTIQFQELYSDTGKPKGELTILKSWESSEKEMLIKFYDIFKPSEPFKFIPVGFYLTSFDLVLLYNAWQRTGCSISLTDLFYNHPCLDLKTSLVLINRGQFKGASLKGIFNSQLQGANVPVWYADKNYTAIERYIKEEAQEFIVFYTTLKSKMITLFRKGE